MRYSVLFVIALIAVSGFIAYFGDLLGRKMGKRRLTIGRLRPRHTAIVATTITGMLISALAVATLVMVNSEFKTLVTQGEQVIRGLKTDNVSLTLGNRALKQRSERLAEEVAKRKDEVDRARRDAAAARTARDRAVKVVNALRREIAQARADLARLQARTDVAERDLTAKTAEIRQVQGQLKTAQAALAAAQRGLAAAQNRLAAAQTKLGQTEAKLAQAEATLKQQQATLTQQQQAIAEQKDMLEKQQEALVALNTEKTAFENQTTELRSSELVLRQGDEIVRGVISPKQSGFGITGDLFSLLDSASKRAEELGAAAGPSGRAVNLVYIRLPKELGIPQPDERKCVDMARDAIVFSNRDVLVQVVCDHNTLAGEQAEVQFRLYVNNLVYYKGDRIAGAQMDGTISEGRVLLAVIGFLQKEVSVAALKAGIVPIANPGSQAALGRNPQEQVEALIAAVDQIKAKHARVNVEAYARADIYAAGPLNMDNMRFAVSKVE